MKIFESRSHALLLFTKGFEQRPTGGRELLCKLNHDALEAILGSRLLVFKTNPSKPKGRFYFANALRGHLDGLDTPTIQSALALINKQEVRRVFVDGSNFGGFVAALKKQMPAIEVITFFHNVESRFFWGAWRTNKTVRSIVVLLANFLAERKAARLSDKRICLSERDSRLLRKFYGKGATHIAPMALEDKLSPGAREPLPIEDEPFALFVGGNFYANREGISWFVQHVAPRIDIKVCVVGKGMEEMRAKLEIPDRVEVIGPVYSLAEWYRRARFVIAPIFDGSGMKTKVAEALMHGKKVVGTPEAFSGYEGVAARAGWCCSSPEEFVSAINRACTTITSTFDPESRALFEEHFSLSAATVRLAEVLGEIRDS
jgi:glycosyltransferase involved in cell wall biosynthesis